MKVFKKGKNIEVVGCFKQVEELKKKAREYCIMRFINHKQLYQRIGFDYTMEHHPMDNDFDTACPGFRKFLSAYLANIDNVDVVREKLKEIKEHIISLFEEKIREEIMWEVEEE